MLVATKGTCIKRKFGLQLFLISKLKVLSSKTVISILMLEATCRTPPPPPHDLKCLQMCHTTLTNIF